MSDPQTHGVIQINRLIHKTFRKNWLELARTDARWRKIPKPLGGEELVYGDKIINVVNHRRGHEKNPKVWPVENAAKYIANGELGMAIGQWKTKKMTKAPWELQIEFSSQPRFRYSFTDSEFGDEATPKLELAYALTCHKGQGSEFGTVILVLPNPCRLLSRELLYTALTRQKERIVILHQGSRADIKKFASDRHSDTANRLTNLFEKPHPVDVGGKFLEDRLIHRTCRGVPVRSKSEVIIYDHLVAKGFDPQYERELTIDGVTNYPDFTIEDDAMGITYYWEHCGMLHDPGYRNRWEGKLEWYRAHDILPYEDGGGTAGTLIVTRDSDKGGISSQEIATLITQILGA